LRKAAACADRGGLNALAVTKLVRGFAVTL
jgi:hypothetical protein